jgi:hypothetical protein
VLSQQLQHIIIFNEVLEQVNTCQIC